MARGSAGAPEELEVRQADHGVCRASVKCSTQQSSKSRPCRWDGCEAKRPQGRCREESGRGDYVPAACRAQSRACHDDLARRLHRVNSTVRSRVERKTKVPAHEKPALRAL